MGFTPRSIQPSVPTARSLKPERAHVNGSRSRLPVGVDFVWTHGFHGAALADNPPMKMGRAVIRDQPRTSE
jgi:hypothetical protein